MNGTQATAIIFAVGYGVQYQTFLHTILGAIIGVALCVTLTEILFPGSEKIENYFS